MNSKMLRGRLLMMAILLICTAMGSMKLRAQEAYLQPIQLSTSPYDATTHWYRLLIAGNYMTAEANSDQVKATSSYFTGSDYEIWCLVSMQNPMPTNQEGATIKLFNKGKQQYVSLTNNNWYQMGGTGEVFTLKASNNIYFEYWICAGGYNGRRTNVFNGRVGTHNLPAGPGGLNLGAAVTQLSIPLTDKEKMDVIPFLNSEGKAGGLNAEQVKPLKRAVELWDNPNYDQYNEQVRTELNLLKSNNSLTYNAFNSGYYRIKNASRDFYNLRARTSKNALIYSTDGANADWRTSASNQDNEVWYVNKLANGKYTIQHVISGKYLSAVDGNPEMGTTAVEGDIVAMNPQFYPGHYALNFSGVAHAMSHNNGAGTTGDIGSYKYGSEDELNRFATAGNDFYAEQSAWLFEPVSNPPGTPLTETEKIDVQRMIWGSGKPGGITATDITTLVSLWNNGSPTNPDNVRHEFNRLISLPLTSRVPLESGYYRIKNGHDEFNRQSKTAALYENTDNTPKWKTADTGNSGIYYLNKKGDNTYEVINISTGRYYNGANTVSVKAEQQAIELSPVNTAKYAGYFKIVSATGTNYPLDNSAHADGHGHGSGVAGGTINYRYSDGGEYAKYNFTLPSSDSYPGASTWMFERVTPPDEYHNIRVKNVLNAKNVVEGFTAEQLTEFERLEDLYRAYGAGFGTAVMAEVERLVALPKTERIQYADGFYVIKNGSYEFYERDANKVVLMNARTDNNVASIGWEKKETATAGSELDEVWYVEKQADGLYTFTNLKTLTKIQEFNANGGNAITAPSANLAAKDMQIKLSYRPDETYHPGQFMFQTNNGNTDLNKITANPEGTGTDFTGNQSGPVLAWHGSFDHHSAWMLRKVDEKVTSLETPQQKVKDNFLRSENRYGGFTTEALSNLKNITSPYRLVEEINKLRKDNTLRVATANGYVRISSAAEAYADASKKKNVYLKYNTLATTTPAGTIANGGLAWNNADRTRVDEIWMLTKSGSSTTEHTLLSPNTKKYVRDAGGVLGDAVNGNIIALDPDLFPAMFEMNFSGQTLSFLDHGLGNGTGGAMGNSRQVTDGTQSYYWAKSGTVADNINQYSTFYFEPATDLDLNVVGQFASFNYPFNVKFETALSTDHTTGVRAYRSTKVEKDRIKVVPIEGQIVTKETPVIIETDAPTIVKLAITSEAGQDFTDNVWEGSLAPKVIETGTYILIPKDREYNGNTYPAGFYPTTVASTINPNRIYITAAKGAKPTTGGQVRSFFIEMEDDTTTGIDNLEVNEAGEKAEYYDLSGRRVVKPTKGVYLTTDGRKVYINK